MRQYKEQQQQEEQAEEAEEAYQGGRCQVVGVVEVQTTVHGEANNANVLKFGGTAGQLWWLGGRMNINALLGLLLILLLALLHFIPAYSGRKASCVSFRSC